jgi:hypothetical protein
LSIEAISSIFAVGRCTNLTFFSPISAPARANTLLADSEMNGLAV